MFTLRKKTVDPSVIKFHSDTTIFSLLRRAVRNQWILYEFSRYKRSRPEGLEIFSDDRSRYTQDILSQLPDCDIVNLHWITGFIDYRSFLGNAHKLPPIVWTLHDMNAFTGGCHYNLGCTKYMHACGACPQLGSDNPNDLSHRIWNRKKKVFDQIKKENIHFVAPSHWLAGKAQESKLLARFKVSTIQYSLDTDDFAPRNKHHAREILGIPLDANTIVFIAQSIQNRRKGFELLRKALSDCDDIDKLFVITVGKNSAPLNLKVPALQIGYLESERLLSMVYSAADLFIIPSLQDNFPNTILESLACGTPVVGFNSSGISEMIQSSRTGILTPVRNIEKFRAAISDLLKNERKRDEMAANCRHTALKLYATGTQARKYERLYESIMNKNSRRAKTNR